MTPLQQVLAQAGERRRPESVESSAAEDSANRSTSE